MSYHITYTAAVNTMVEMLLALAPVPVLVLVPVVVQVIVLYHIIMITET